MNEVTPIKTNPPPQQRTAANAEPRPALKPMDAPPAGWQTTTKPEPQPVKAKEAVAPAKAVAPPPPAAMQAYDRRIRIRTDTLAVILEHVDPSTGRVMLEVPLQISLVDPDRDILVAQVDFRA